MEWQNWSGKVRANPQRIERPASEQEVVSLLRRAAADGLGVRLQGTAHSHAPLVATDAVLVETDALSGVVATDFAARRARIRGGTKLSALGPPLRDAGLALLNQGDIDRQSIAGALSTGTHGTGPSLRNFSAALLGARIALADGEVVECDAHCEPELFAAAQLSLGALGILLEVELAVREAYRLKERMWLEPIDDVLDRLDEHIAASRHFELFWLPGKPRAACKALAETDEPVRHPLGDEGSRLAWSYEVLANHRPDKHTEMEYSVPADRGVECFRALREMIERDFRRLAWPLELRTLAADDVWLSTANGRETITLSIHEGAENDEKPLFAACEAIFRRFDGRPHWGKVHGRRGADLAALHRDWADWWRVRDHFDPGGRFLNDHLIALRG